MKNTGRRLYRRLKSPLHVQIELSGRCNLKCRHCYNFWRAEGDLASENGSAHDMTEQVAERVLQQCIKHEVLAITLTGGEPLLKRELIEKMARGALEAGIKVSLNSNLACLTSEYAKMLQGLSIIGVLASLLGSNSKVHDSITGIPGSFEMTVRGIRLCQDHGIKVLPNMVVTKPNVQDVQSTARLAKELGCNSLCVTPAVCPASCNDFSEFGISQSEIVEALDRLVDVSNEIGIRPDSQIPLPYCFLPKLQQPEPFMKRRCVGGVIFGMISSDGQFVKYPVLQTSIPQNK